MASVTGAASFGQRRNGQIIQFANSRSLRKVLLTPLVTRLSGSHDEIARRLLSSLGSDLNVYPVRSIEKDFTVLGTDLSCVVIELIVTHGTPNVSSAKLVPSPKDCSVTVAASVKVDEMVTGRSTN